MSILGELKKFAAWLKRVLVKAQTEPEEIRDGIAAVRQIISIVEIGAGETKLTAKAKSLCTKLEDGLDLWEAVPM